MENDREEDVKLSGDGGGFCFILPLKIQVCNQRLEMREPYLGEILSLLLS